jgi:hypothetical protein
MPLPPKNPPMITVMPSGNLQTVPSPKVFPWVANSIIIYNKKMHCYNSIF